MLVLRVDLNSISKIKLKLLKLWKLKKIGLHSIRPILHYLLAVVVLKLLALNSQKLCLIILEILSPKLLKKLLTKLRIVKASSNNLVTHSQLLSLKRLNLFGIWSLTSLQIIKMLFKANMILRNLEQRMMKFQVVLKLNKCLIIYMNILKIFSLLLIFLMNKSKELSLYIKVTLFQVSLPLIHSIIC